MTNTPDAEKTKNATVREKELDLFEFLRYLRSRMWIVLGGLLVVLLAACVYVFFIATPIYEATAQIYVVNSSDSAINLSDLQIGSYLTSDYQWVFKTWEVNQQVINNLQLPYTVTQASDMLTVTNPSNTRLLLITVASPDAAEAATMANEYANVASQYISDTMLADKPTVLSTALEPLKPVRPRKLLIVAASLAGAAFVCLWALFIAYMRDDKIKTVSDMIKHTGSAPLAVVPITSAMVPKKRYKER